jgi:hypothetical protein
MPSGPKVQQATSMFLLFKVMINNSRLELFANTDLLQNVSSQMLIAIGIEFAEQLLKQD